VDALGLAIHSVGGIIKFINLFKKTGWSAGEFEIWSLLLAQFESLERDNAVNPTQVR
jgi:hypothetical protein